MNQVPQSEGAPAQHAAEEGSEAHVRITGERVLWSEELPWVDDVASAVDATTTPQDPVGQLVEVFDTRPPSPRPDTAAGNVGQSQPKESPPPRSRRRKRRRQMAVAFTIASVGAIAVAAGLATLHDANNGPGDASVRRGETGGAAPDTASETLEAHSPRPSVSRRPGTGSAFASLAAEAGETAVSPSSSPGATSNPLAVGLDSHSTKPRVAHSTHPMPQQPSATATTTRSPYVIQATAVLNPGQSVAWGKAQLAMTSGGNLVVTDERHTVRWASHTSGSGLQMVFQDDGVLAVYNSQGTVQWSSNTTGHPGAVLEITPDGNVRIRIGDTVLWQTGTEH